MKVVGNPRLNQAKKALQLEHFNFLPQLSAIVIESDRFGNRVVVLNVQTRYGGFMLCLSEFYASIVDIIYMSRLGCLKFAPSSPPNAAYVRPNIEARRRCDTLYSEKSQT